MPIQSINFKKEGTDYYSDPIKITATDIVVRVKLSSPGAIILERSISGDDFVYETQLQPSSYSSLILEKGITSCIPDQFLRLRFVQSEPETISILQ